MTKQYDSHEELKRIGFEHARKSGNLMSAALVVRYEHGTAEPGDPLDDRHGVKNRSMLKAAALARAASIAAGGAAAWVVMGGDPQLADSGAICVVVSPQDITAERPIELMVWSACMLVQARLSAEANRQERGVSIMWLVPRDVNIEAMLAGDGDIEVVGVAAPESGAH